MCSLWYPDSYWRLHFKHSTIYSKAQPISAIDVRDYVTPLRSLQMQCTNEAKQERKPEIFCKSERELSSFVLIMPKFGLCSWIIRTIFAHGLQLILCFHFFSIFPPIPEVLDFIEGYCNFFGLPAHYYPDRSTGSVSLIYDVTLCT